MSQNVDECKPRAAGTELTMLAAVLYVAGIPLFTPAVPILLMQCVPAHKRGMIMGLDSSINSVARWDLPLIVRHVIDTHIEPSSRVRFRYIASAKSPYRVVNKASALRAGKRAPR